MEGRGLNHMGSTQEDFLKEVVFKERFEGSNRQERGKGGKGGMGGGGQSKRGTHWMLLIYP